EIYLIRSLTVLGTIDACYTGDCDIDDSPLFGAIIPVVVMGIIFFRAIFSKKTINYRFGALDALFISYIVVVLFGCVYAYDINKAFEYCARFTFLGVSYFF